MDTYIIRIYRRGENGAETLAGTVEEPGIPEKKPFVNPDQLWDILNLKKKKMSKWKRKGGLNKGGGHKRLSLMKVLIFISIGFIFATTSCSLLPKNPHPELSRSFDWRTGEPGEYPFCRNYDEELLIKIQMEGY